MKQFIDKIKNKDDLSFEESKAAFELLMEGKAIEQEIFDPMLFRKNFHLSRHQSPPRYSCLFGRSRYPVRSGQRYLRHGSGFHRQGS